MNIPSPLQQAGPNVCWEAAPGAQLTAVCTQGGDGGRHRTCAHVVTAHCLASASTAGPAALTLKATMDASAAAASCTSDDVTGPMPEYTTFTRTCTHKATPSEHAIVLLHLAVRHVGSRHQCQAATANFAVSDVICPMHAECSTDALLYTKHMQNALLAEGSIAF